MSKQTQKELEGEMESGGIERYRKKRRAAEEKSIESTTPAGQWLLANAIQPLSEALEAWKREAKTRPGKAHRAIAYYLSLIHI